MLPDSTRPPKRTRLRIELSVLAALVAFMAFAVWFVAAMPGETHRGPLLPLGSEDRQLAENLKAHVAAVAGEEHNVLHPAALERSARYIEATLAGLGYTARRHEFETLGVKVRNLEVARAGPGDAWQVLVVGAHYDSAQGAVGADDNGSGVAALIELARAFREFRPREGLEVRFVFYVNEELPWFGTENMGSNRHAESLAREGREVVAMMSLETIGWYSSAPGSQHYPFPFNLLYPSTGNFIGFVANPRSRALLRRIVGTFRRHAAFPSEGAVGLESIRGISWSDQWSYWRRGWPAVMVTDTALYRNPHYHSRADRPETLDYDSLARVVRGLEAVVRDLATAEN